MINAAARVGSKKGTAEKAGRALRILYADDMVQLSGVVAIVLADAGHTVDTVVNGREALTAMESKPGHYDVLLTDHFMPQMDGLELVTAVRKTTFAGKILVFCSEIGDEAEAAYKKLKVDNVLQKPVSFDRLREMLATF